MITAKDNEMVKNVVKLMNSARYRWEKRCFAAEGVRLCMDGALSGAAIQQFFYTEAAQQKYAREFAVLHEKAAFSAAVSEAVFKKMSDTMAPQGFLCVFSMLDKTHKMCTIKKKGCYAALENIQDPSNLGTILRTAEALGMDGVLLSDDCCDVYAPKVVRGSMGAVFRVPLMIEEDFTAVIRSLTDSGILTLASTPHEAEDISQLSFPEGGVMLIGNEGNGLCAETIAACRERVRIPMKGRAESLNAAAAAAILLYCLQNGNTVCDS